MDQVKMCKTVFKKVKGAWSALGFCLVPFNSEDTKQPPSFFPNKVVFI